MPKFSFPYGYLGPSTAGAHHVVMVVEKSLTTTGSPLGLALEVIVAHLGVTLTWQGVHAMSIGGVYTPAIFIACPYTPSPGVYTPRRILEGCTPVQYSSRAPLAMNIAGVYRPPIFMACPRTPCQGVCTPCRRVYTPHNECWSSVGSSIIHRVPL